MRSGIYAIVNILNFKYYIGSASDFKKRWAVHVSELNRNVHGNRYLQHSFNKYGKENFIFVVLEYTKNLVERENYWISNLNCCDRNTGYNICLIAEGVLGVKRSDETKFKLSLLKKGKKLSEETKIKISNSLKGRKNPHSGYVHSEETKAKLSKTMTGRKHSEETKIKMRAKVMSEEARLKISIAQKARWCKLK